MRRFLLALVLVTLGVAWLIPATNAQTGHSGRSNAQHAAAKKKQHKKTPTPVRRGKPKKHPKKHKATSTPRPTATRTARPLPVNTSTPTATATIRPTATSTATPVPLTASMDLKADLPAGYTAAFFACGLPANVTASFSPDPALSRADDSSGTFASARTTMTLTVPHTVTAGTYGLTFHAYYQDPTGTDTTAPPGGNLEPTFAVLTVAPGSAMVAPADGVPADNGQNCSAIPPGYQPTPQPTPAASDYTFTSWVSDSHPATGETVTVYAKLTQGTRPIGGAAVNFTWYTFGIAPAPCHVVTDPTGTASCSFVNSAPLPGVTASVQATAYYGGYFFSAWTSYTM